ncbi:RsmE family RNA methyltransferase [Bacillus pacificus]
MLVNGKTAVCSIDEITSEFINTAIVEWVEASSELPVFVTIASGLPKGDKLELIFQKGTELGAAAFLPFPSISLYRKMGCKKKLIKKVERLRKIVKRSCGTIT